MIAPCKAGARVAPPTTLASSCRIRLAQAGGCRWGVGDRAGAPARRARRRRARPACSGSRSRRSRRRTTRSPTRWRCSLTVRPGAICARRGRTSTSAATSGTPSCWRSARGSSQIVVATTARLRALGAAAEVREAHHGSPAGDALRSRGRVARAALRRDRAPAADPPLVHRQLLGDLAACRRERVQRRAREALLRQPAAGDLRSGARRRCRADGSCSSPSSCRCPSRSSGSSRCSPSSRRGRTSCGRCSCSRIPNMQPLSVRLPTIQAQTSLGVFLAALLHRLPRADHRLPHLPALVPARLGPRRSDQGVMERHRPTRVRGVAVAAIEFQDVSKVFPDGTRAVDSLDLSIEEGEFMVLRRPVGLRQDDGASHGRGPRGDQRRDDH